MTYSIAAYDPDEKAWGVAVASKFLAAGAIVSWAEANAGAIATQAFARVSAGPDGLALLRKGKSAQEALDILLANDPKRASRQIGIVDKDGGVAAHTGLDCNAWAGHKIGKYFCCQGNILTGEETLTAMSIAFRSAGGELADRLVTALYAGDSIGGDRRGKQSAAVLVVRENAGYGGDTDRYLDLRVDDDPEPVRKLQQLLESHHLFFGQSRSEDKLPISEDIARELQTYMLQERIFIGDVNGIWDEFCKDAFWTLIGNENLEERWNPDGDTDSIDRNVLEYLRQRFSNLDR